MPQVLPFSQASYSALSLVNLTAADLSLVINPVTAQVDPGLYPSFSGSPLKFGFVGGAFTNVGTPASTLTWRIDNLALSIAQAVPEPSTGMLWAAAITLLAGRSRGRSTLARVIKRRLR